MNLRAGLLSWRRSKTGANCQAKTSSKLEKIFIIEALPAFHAFFLRRKSWHWRNWPENQLPTAPPTRRCFKVTVRRWNSFTIRRCRLNTSSRKQVITLQSIGVESIIGCYLVNIVITIILKSCLIWLVECAWFKDTSCGMHRAPRGHAIKLKRPSNRLPEKMSFRSQ